jgi:hypothetical protein
MKQFVIRIGLFLALIIVLMQALGLMLDSHFSKQTSKQLDHKSNWIFQQEDQSLDFVVLGSSRALNILDVLTMEEASDKKGINLATEGSSLAGNYLIFERFMRNNTTDVVILNLDYSALHSDRSYSYAFADYAFAPLFSDDTVSAIYYDEIPTFKYYLWKVAPFMKYAEFNEHYPFYENVTNPDYEYRNHVLDSTKGSQLLYDPNYKNFNDRDTVTIDPTPNHIDLKYLQRIASFCNKRDIKLITYCSPYPAEIFQYSDFASQSEVIVKLAKELKFTYLDFSHNDIGKTRRYFRDWGHLNAQGALLFSKMLTLKMQDEKHL